MPLRPISWLTSSHRPKNVPSSMSSCETWNRARGRGSTGSTPRAVAALRRSSAKAFLLREPCGTVEAEVAWGWISGNSSSTRSRPRASTAAATARSGPTIPAVATSSDAASRARASTGAMASAEANSRKATRWSRSRTTVSAVMLLRARPARGELVERLPQCRQVGGVDVLGPEFGESGSGRALGDQHGVVGGLDPPGPDHGRGAHPLGACPQHQAGGVLDVVDAAQAQVQGRAPDPQEPPRPGQELAFGCIAAVDVDVEYRTVGAGAGESGGAPGGHGVTADRGRSTATPSWSRNPPASATVGATSRVPNPKATAAPAVIPRAAAPMVPSGTRWASKTWASAPT